MATKTTTLYVKKGRRYVPVQGSQVDHDGELLLMCGVRYALGSSTYVPGSAMAWVEENWDGLSDNSRFVVLRDTITWLADRRLFDEPGKPNSLDYREEWSAWAQRMLARQSGAWATSVAAAALYSPHSRQSLEVQPFLKWINNIKEDAE